METTEKNLIENLLNLALKSGADEAEVIVAKGQGQSAECRLGKIEAVEIAEEAGAGAEIEGNQRGGGTEEEGGGGAGPRTVPVALQHRRRRHGVRVPYDGGRGGPGRHRGDNQAPPPVDGDDAA